MTHLILDGRDIDSRCAAALDQVAQLIGQRAAEARDAIARDFARARVRHQLRPYAVHADRLLRLPARFACPECGDRCIVEFDEWSVRDGTPTAGGFRVMCEPDTDAELAAWARDEDHVDGHRHWQSDWQPLIDRVGRWLARNVRVVA